MRINLFAAEHVPAGIIDSVEAQVNGNLNEWVHADMNECWSNPEPIQIVNNQQSDYIELG